MARAVFRASATVLANHALRRVLCAYCLFITSLNGAWISILVWAYARGGSKEAGIMALAQLLPAAAAAPVVSSLADQRSPGLLLLGGYGVQAGGLALTAAAVRTDLVVPVWVFAVVASTAVVATRPAQAALVPALVRRVEELGAANSTFAWIEGGGVVVAGLMTGAVVGAFGAAAGLALAAALAAVALVVALPARRVHRLGAEGEPLRLGAVVVGGLAAVRESSVTRVLLALLGAAWVVVGALDILLVVLAIRVLEKGAGWVGFLNTAYGLGAAVAALLLGGAVAVRRPALPILAGAAVLSLGLASVAAVPTALGAVFLLAVAGGGRAVFDIGTRALLQRVVDADVLGRVFGIAEGLASAGCAAGSVIAPLLVWALGPKAALVAAAGILPATAAVLWRRLRRLDRVARVPIVEIGLLRALPIFQFLPGPALEVAASALVPVELEAGEVLIREGDPDADRFYVVAAGEVEVARKGVAVARLGRGAALGEMALLRDMPRTATVTAVTPLLVYALDREPFLLAVTGHGATSTAVASTMNRRLGELATLGVAPDPLD